MNAQSLAWLRLRNQALTGAPLATPEQVVRRFGAMQAQELALAKWSIAQRTRGATEAAIDRALDAGTILRTHLLRPTWHFVLPEDIRWMTALTAPRIRAAMAYYDRQLALTAAVFAKSNVILARALTGGKSLTRKELASALARKGIAAEGQRLGHLVMRAELELVICSGARRGAQQTYALLDERAPRAAALSQEEALVALARRYFASRGPATAKDFAWWAGLTPNQAKKAVALLDGELESLVVDGRSYWFTAPNKRAVAAPAVHLLQSYDEYVISYGESREVIFPEGRPAKGPGVVAREQVPFVNAVFADGRVVGRWRRTIDKGAATVEVTLSRSLTPTQKRALDAECERFGRFLAMPIRRA